MNTFLKGLHMEFVILISKTANYKIAIEFHNLQNYDAHITMQELRKIDLNMIIISKRLEKYTNLSL